MADLSSAQKAALIRLRTLLRPTRLRRARVVKTDKERWPFEVRATADDHYLLAIGDSVDDALARAIEWATREVPRG